MKLLKVLRINPSLKRNRRLYCQETYNKTTAIFISEQPDAPLMIESLNTRGFVLNNKMSIIGSVALFPRSILSWNITSSSDINEDSLSLFHMVEPKLDLLIIGAGDPGFKIDLEILSFMRKKGVGTEVLPTEVACSVYNFMVNEGRFVAGAFIPPSFSNS